MGKQMLWMNRTLALYIFGAIAAALAVAFPSLIWISLVAFLIILPLGAVLIWRGEGRPIGALGFRISKGWLRHLAIGLLFGLGIPVLFLLMQQLGGWIALVPGDEQVQSLMTYLPPAFIGMGLVVTIGELVFPQFAKSGNRCLDSYSIVLFALGCVAFRLDGLSGPYSWTDLNWLGFSLGVGKHAQPMLFDSREVPLASVWASSRSKSELSPCRMVFHHSAERTTMVDWTPVLVA